MRLLALFLCACATALVCAPSIATAQGAQVIRGRVLKANGQPVRGANVTVVGLQSKIERTAHTNGDGVYTVLFTTGEGEYVATVRALGYSPKKQRVLQEGQVGNVLVSNFTMSAATELASVDVKGDRPASEKDGKSIGDNAEDVDLEHGRLFSLDPSDLSTLMQGMPGVTYIPGKNGEPGTYSVLGADPSENGTTLDGMAFQGSRLPADALASASVATSSFDASRGGFSGGLLSMTTRSGSNVWQGSLTGILSDPRLAWKDPSYPTPLSRTQDWSGSLSGPLIKNKIFYFAAYQLNRSTTGLQSLLNLKSSIAEQQYGLIPDTVQTVSQTLQNLGIPLTSSAIPSQNISTSQSASLKLDFNPTATTAASIFGTASWSNTDGSGISALTYPIFGSGSRSSNGSLMFNASTYFGSILNEFNIALSRQVNRNAPYVALPGGSVLIPQSFSDGRTGLTSLQFGGNTQSGRTSTNSNTLAVRNATSWLTVDSRHQFKLSEEFTFDHNSASAVSDQFGVFAYQSISDLMANQPTSYSRTMSSQARATSAARASFSLGDTYRASDAWSFQYGMRLDLARSGTQPQYNPLVDSLFGRRTDQVPNDVGLSPRFGFQWIQGGTQAYRRPIMLPRRGAGSGTLMRPSSPITVNGGFGAFRGVIDPSTVASLVDATGLPNTIRQLTCVGAATPIPDWTAFSTDPDAVPMSCLDGTAPVEFSTDKPNVRLYDPSYHAPLSWDASLNVNGFVKKGWTLGFGAQLRLGYNGTSSVDLNLRHTPAFQLSDEGNRPVYVDPTAIVSNTGAIAPGASRVTDQFGSVLNNLSDLRSLGSAFSVNFSRLEPLFGKLPINGSYTYNINRQQFRGSNGSTAGDPLAVEWASGQSPTHSIQLNSYFNIKWFNIMMSLNFNSGTPYTPLISGDVNGDGMADDRAFVFDPAKVSDPVFAQQLQQLLAGTSSLGRKCLASQLGQMAGLNSCSTGWRLQPNFNFSIIDPTKHMSFGHRLSFSLTTQNTMSVLTRVFGLSNTFLARSYSAPDPTLLYVNGFDPATQQFKYQVNQRFGVSDEGMRGRRFYPPFQLGIRGRLELGGPPYRSFAQGLGLVPTKNGEALTRTEIRDQLIKRLTSNPVDMILKMRDSLLLTEKQVAGMTTASAGFTATADSLFKPIEDYVFDKGQDTDDKELMKRISKVQPKMQKAMLTTLRDVSKLLTDDQFKRLPPQLQAFLQIADQVKDQG